MIVKTIVLSTALAACPVSPTQDSVYVQVGPASEGHLPVLPEQHHPDHPADEDPSQTYRGMVYVRNTNTASGAISTDSSAFGARIPWPIWHENNFILVSSVRDLGVGERVPAKPDVANSNVSPNTSRHMANPSSGQIRTSNTRRRPTKS